MRTLRTIRTQIFRRSLSSLPFGVKKTGVLRPHRPQSDYSRRISKLGSDDVLQPRRGLRPGCVPTYALHADCRAAAITSAAALAASASMEFETIRWRGLSVR